MTEEEKIARRKAAVAEHDAFIERVSKMEFKFPENMRSIRSASDVKRILEEKKRLKPRH